MKPGDIVIAHLPTGEAYVRVVRPTANRRGFVVDLAGAHVIVSAVRGAPKAVQP